MYCYHASDTTSAEMLMRCWSNVQRFTSKKTKISYTQELMAFAVADKS